MKFSTNRLLTSRNIFRLVNSFSIFKAYCTNFNKIGISFISDLPGRAKRDTNPSCQIEYIGGDLLYTDFGEGSYRAIPYVMRKFNISFVEALNKINLDFNLKLFRTIDNFTSNNETNNFIYNPISYIEKSPTIINVKYTPYSQRDLEYWELHGWLQSMLERASISSISDYWITIAHKNMNNVHFNANNELIYTFDYYRHKGVFRRKIYLPEHKEGRKFISNVDNTIVQNWDLLPKNGGDTLFITSSKKDTGPMWRLNGYECNAIAPNNEIGFIPVECLYKLKKRWKNIIIYFDNDYTGIVNAQKLGELYDLPYIYNPLGAPKDPSDYVRKYGLREFNWMLQNKLQTIIKT